MAPLLSAATSICLSQVLFLTLSSSGEACTVTLQKQTSSSSCSYKHFGCKGNQMWASDGCAGYFTCNNHSNVYCHGGLGKRASCPCVSGPPPPPPPTPWPSCAVWKGEGMDAICAPPCEEQTNETACSVSPYKCVWQTGTCSNPLPCEKITTEPACSASPYECAWNNGACNITMCNFNGSWNMTYPFGQAVGGGMHYSDMHIFQAPGSKNFSIEWRTGYCTPPDCYLGHARATGSMMTNWSLKTKNGTADHLYGVDEQGFGSISSFPNELDKSPAPVCSLLTFPNLTYGNKTVKWCKKPFCPPDSPPNTTEETIDEGMGVVV